MEPQASPLTSTGLLILRIGMGGYMLTHGWGKLQTLLAGDSEAFADPIGVGAPISLVMAVFAEVVCAVLLMLGLLTRLAAVPLVITVAVAAFIVHSADPWTSAGAAELFRAGEVDFPKSREPALMYLVAFLTLIFTGPGEYSLDALIRRRRTAKPDGTAGDQTADA